MRRLLIIAASVLCLSALVAAQQPNQATADRVAVIFAGPTPEGSARAFAAAAAGGIAPYAYAWDFGDASTAVGPAPTHAYADNGSFPVTLRVSDATGRTATTSFSVAIVNAAPSVKLAGPAAGSAGLPLTFTAAATDPGTADQAAGFSFAWDFGDGAVATGASPSHAYATAGTYTVLVTATDKDGAQSTPATASITITAAPTGPLIDVDAAWLAARVPPYQLTAANTTYRLQADVAANGTAFVVAAGGITLDLNGHTATYDGQAPIANPSGGFEAGDLSGWDASEMPHIRIVPTSEIPGLWGSWGARFSAPASATPAKETMISGPIAIPAAGIGHEGIVTAKGHFGGGVSVSLSVLDASGSVLGTRTQSPDNIDNGPTLVVPFRPAAAGPVRLRLDVTPAANKASTVYIDGASVDRVAAYGVTINYHCNKFRLTSSVPGGTIVQGGGGSARSDCVHATTENTGLAVDGVTLAARGRDSQLILASYYRDVTIRNVAFVAALDYLSNRQAAMSMLRLLQAKGTVVIEGNTFDGSHQNCISVVGDTDYLTAMTSVSIKRNTIRHDAKWGDAYGIGIERLRNFEVAFNTIHPIAGRGIILQADMYGTNRLDLIGGTVHDNDIIVQERATLENGSAINATALRLRNFQGRFQDVEIYNNSCVARIGTAPGMSQFASGFKPTFINDHGQMTGANVVVRDNFFKGLVVDASKCPANFKAYGITFAQIDGGTGVTYLRNRCESNQRCVNFGDADGINESDITMQGTVLVKSNEGDPSLLPGFHGVSAGGWGSKVANVRMIDTTTQGGADITPLLEGTGSKDLVITAPAP
jgi:PKD repeat protein